MVYEHYLTGTEQTLGYDQRADGVVADDSPCIADYVGVAFFQAEELVCIEAGIHAGYDGEVLGGRGVADPAVESRCIASVVGQYVVDGSHGNLRMMG